MPHWLAEINWAPGSWDSLLAAFKGKESKLREIKHTWTWTDGGPLTCALLPPGPTQAVYSTTSSFQGPPRFRARRQYSVLVSVVCLRFAHSPAPPARPGGPVGHLPSSCHHTSCRARHRLHFCCRTCGRSWMPPQYRDKPPRPGDRRSGPTGSREREEEVGLHLERLVGDSKKTGKWNKGCDTPDAKREMRPEKKNRLLGRRE